MVEYVLIVVISIGSTNGRVPTPIYLGTFKDAPACQSAAKIVMEKLTKKSSVMCAPTTSSRPRISEERVDPAFAAPTYTAAAPGGRASATASGATAWGATGSAGATGAGAVPASASPSGTHDDASPI